MIHNRTFAMEPMNLSTAELPSLFFVGLELPSFGALWDMFPLFGDVALSVSVD